MPKSSIATRTPSARSSSSLTTAISGSSISIDSVISSVSSSGSRPDSASASRTSEITSLCCSCLTDRLTQMYSGGSLGPQPLHRHGLQARLAQHPASDRDDQAGLLGERDEVAGLRRARARGGASAAAPPSRRRGRRRGARSAGSAARTGRSRGRAEGRRAAPGGRARRRASRARTGGSCPCRRAWRCTSRRRRRGSARRRRRRGALHDRDADAAAHDQLLAGDHQRRRRSSSTRSATSVATSVLSRSSSSTTNSSPPKRAAVSLVADAVGQALGDVDQRGVAGAVAEAVVDRLEVVDVEEHHTELGGPRGARGRSRGAPARRTARGWRGW